jgi:SAM-dependent methyltransferase
MNAVGWDMMAAWRDQRMGETGDLWHRAIIDPTLLSVIGSVRDLRVFEIACGNGYLARRFAADGARTVVAVDASVPTLATARAREAKNPRGVRYEVRDASHLEDFPTASYDLVVANMALMDIAEGEKAIREAARLLAAGGRFIFSICHPCFDTNDRSMWVVERAQTAGGAFTDTVWRKVSAYRVEGVQSVPWQISETETMVTDSYHRTLSTYSRYLRSAGLAIARLEEPTPLPEALDGSPQGRFMQQIPLHLVVEARRLGDSAARVPGRGPDRGSDLSPPASRRTARSSPRAVRRSGSRGRRRDSGSAHRDSSPGS